MADVYYVGMICIFLITEMVKRSSHAFNKAPKRIALDPIKYPNNPINFLQLHGLTQNKIIIQQEPISTKKINYHKTKKIIDNFSIYIINFQFLHNTFHFLVIQTSFLQPKKNKGEREKMQIRQ